MWIGKMLKNYKQKRDKKKRKPLLIFTISKILEEGHVKV